MATSSFDAQKTNVNLTKKVTFTQQLANLVGLVTLANESDEVAAANNDIPWEVLAYGDSVSQGAPVTNAESLVGLRKLIRYAESGDASDDSPAMVQDCKVFIQGVDVSDQLKGEIQWECVGVAGHGTATITLSNAQDRFVWSEKNLTEERFSLSETEKADMWRVKSNTDINPPVTSAKGTISFPKWDLIPNKAIFQRFDPVRIFVSYPWRVPGKKEDELWMPAFSGFVEYANVSDDDLTGNSTITLQLADFRHMVLEDMRVTTDRTLGLLNPADDLGFRPRTSGSGTAGLDQFGVRRFFNPEQVTFYDDVLTSLYGQPFPDAKLEEAVRELLVYKPQNVENNVPNRGVRDVTLGGAFYFNATERAEKRAFLEQYHKFCLFGPKGRPWTHSEVEEVGKGTTTFGVYNPTQHRLWFLLPEDGSGPKNLADLSVVNATHTHEVNWNNRLDVLKKFVESLDYECFTTPCGDTVVEFNFADFRPEDFGSFKEVFRFHQHLKNTEFGDEQSPNPLTCLTYVTGYAKGAASKEDSVAGLAQKTFVFSPLMVARYGVKHEVVQAPFLTLRDKGIAQSRAVIEFQKRNSECNTLSFSAAFRPFLLPNRPIHHLPRTRMGCTQTVSYTWGTGGDAVSTVAFGLRHVRTFTGHYRSADDLVLDDLQLVEIENAGMTSDVAVLAAMDNFNADDPIERQVYTSIMGGEHLPTSVRLGWKSGLSPASGVYVLDLSKPQREEQANEEDASTAHEDNAADQTAVFTKEVEDEEASTVVFASDPVETFNITSPFGTRTNATQGASAGTEPHDGIDFGVPVNTPLYAVADARIIRAELESRASFKGNGNIIQYITSDGKYRVSNLHLKSIITRKGATVKAGDLIGYTGGKKGDPGAGRSTGPHLHFAVVDLSTGKAVDPEPLLPHTGVPGRSA